MVFHAPPWAKALPIQAAPDDVTVEEFMYNEQHGRKPFAHSCNPFTCGVTGRTYGAAEVRQRVDFIGRGLAKRLGWSASEGTEWDKVACIYSLNTIDYIPTCHAVHRLNGIVTPASAAYTAAELTHQLSATSASVLFTCVPLLNKALEAASAIKISKDRIFIMDMPGETSQANFVSLSVLIEEGRLLPQIPPAQFFKGQGSRQVAFICFSSGTSGLPKGVMLSHRNIISNIIQVASFESHGRQISGVEKQVGLGVLPFSHIYGLVIISHILPWCGDEVVVLPRYNLDEMLATTQKFKINRLPLVPPIAIQLLQNVKKCGEYDLSSVAMLTSGAAPLGEETVKELRKVWPNWHVGQGYGLTESSPAVCTTSEHDMLPGSSGSILPGVSCKLIDVENGKEVTELETPGELYVKSPSIFLGYMNSVQSTAETIVWDKDGRWLRTGDVVIVHRSPLGNEHITVVDRIKELIKVKGNQVAPAELESHILSHHLVDDCAVIPVPDALAGEVPKAFVIKSLQAGNKSDLEVRAAIRKHVEDHKARYKWLQGGIEFVTQIPKSPSGKILRRVLKDQERQKKLQAHL